MKNRFLGKKSLKKKQNIFAETNLEFFKEKILGGKNFAKSLSQGSSFIIGPRTHSAQQLN